MKKILAVVLVLSVLLTCAPIPSFSAENSNSRLTHLNSTNLIKTNLHLKELSDINRLFDGDSSASHEDITPIGTPDGNGIFSETWYGDGETKYITIDLGDLYELSQINTYWGWAPEAFPGWNTWEYAVPSSYKIYVADTEEGLVTASPIVEATGLEKNSNHIADSLVDVSVVCRYVKIVATCREGRYALREVEFIGDLSPRISTLGANIRLEDGDISAGLRFGAKIDKSLLDIDGRWEYDSSSDIEFGMYLLPLSILEAGETLSEYLTSGGTQALKVPAKKYLSQNDDTITYTAVLVDIRENAYNQTIVALPYATVGGKTTYFDECCKSFAGVAQTAADSYLNGNPNISSTQYDSLKPIADVYEEPILYFDVDAAAKEIGLDYIGAVLPAELFVDIEGKYLGYKIDGSYKVDRDTIYKLHETPCVGKGKIAWVDYNDCGSWSSSDEQPEFVPVDLLDDPIYMSMILPSDRTSFLSNRTNGSFLDVAEDKWINVITIGAVYKNMAVEIPDDAEFTVCISDVNLAMRTTKSDGWFEALNVKVPRPYNCLYYLPWTLGDKLGVYEVTDRVTIFDDHAEIKLYGRDLNATDAKAISDEVQQCVYHYWGSKYYFDCSGSEVLGIACSYKIWVKEDSASEYLVASIGADWRDSNESALQAFAGKKYAVGTTPTTLVGHNVPLSQYREVMDSQKVQEILGLD